jgi:hypothetical protein
MQVQPDCESEDNGEGECAPVSVSWEGSAEMQSGDILLVRIDDSRLVGQTAPRREAPTVDRYLTLTQNQRNQLMWRWGETS